MYPPETVRSTGTEKELSKLSLGFSFGCMLVDGVVLCDPLQRRREYQRLNNIPLSGLGMPCILHAAVRSYYVVTSPPAVDKMESSSTWVKGGLVMQTQCSIHRKGYPSTP
jgi:hypothetical protein